MRHEKAPTLDDYQETNATLQTKRAAFVGALAVSISLLQLGGGCADALLDYASSQGHGIERSYNPQDPVRVAEYHAFETLRHDEVVRCQVNEVSINPHLVENTRFPRGPKQIPELNFTATLNKGPAWDQYPGKYTQDGRRVEVTWNGAGDLVTNQEVGGEISPIKGFPYHLERSGRKDLQWPGGMSQQVLGHEMKYGLDLDPHLAYPRIVHLSHQEKLEFEDSGRSGTPARTLAVECATIGLVKDAQGTVKVKEVLFPESPVAVPTKD